MSKSRKSAIIAAIVIVIALLAAGAAWFVLGAGGSSNSFYPGTTLNGTDISGMTPAEVEKSLRELPQHYTMDVKFRDSQVSFSGTEIGLKAADDLNLQALKDQQNRKSPKETSEEELSLVKAGLFSLNEDVVKKKLAACPSLDTSRMKKSVNAHLVYDQKAGSFKLQGGSAGNAMDPDTTIQAVIRSIRSGKTAFVADEEGVYDDPLIMEGGDNADAVLAEANDFLKVSLTYDFPDGQKEVLDKKTIAPLVYINKEGKADINQDDVQNAVDQMLKKHQSGTKAIDFRTTGGSTIQIQVPVDGQSIDGSKLYEMILADLTAGRSGRREVPVTQESGGTDSSFGGNYVEVDLNNQVLYLYKDGKQILSSDIVSGDVSHTHMTPTGVYKVYSMETNVTLRGPGYESPVSYWMPFNGGIGMHDATWRGSFGGTIYQYNGSHGCINLPLGKASEIFSNISIGYYVVVYGGVTYVDGQVKDSGYVPSGESQTEAPETSAPRSSDNGSSQPQTRETSAPARETSAPAPETSAPVPETSAPAPETSAPAPETSAPTPETSAPEPDPEPEPEPDPSAGGEDTPAPEDTAQ